MGINDIIKSILADTKLRNSKSFENRIYTDQPILHKASQMAGYLPEKYAEMRAIATSPVYLGRPEAWIFVKQANFMLNFEDDFEYNGEYVQYFPTFQRMGDKELRGYFSWRTKVRKGDIRLTSLSFVYVYIYELLNCVGFSQPENAFCTLKSFWKAYRELDPRIDRFAVLWMCDFVVFHNLDSSLLDGVYDFEHEKSLEVLYERARDDTEMFNAICALSSYNVFSSKGYKMHSDIYEFVIPVAYRILADYWDNNRKNSLFERNFGTVCTTSYNMFMSAIYSGRNNHPDSEYKFNSLHEYYCSDGVWKRLKIVGAPHKSSGLGVFVKAADRILRLRFDIKPQLTEGKETKVMISCIDKAIELWRLEEKRRKAIQINIDISMLSGIRASSDITRDKLITEEEMFGAEDSVVISETVENTSHDSPLDTDESAFLKMLLAGENYVPYLDSKGIMLSVIADSVNEKLYDRFCDTVIDFNGDVPYIIEDYLEDIKEFC